MKRKPTCPNCMGRKTRYYARKYGTSHYICENCDNMFNLAGAQYADFQPSPPIASLKNKTV